MMATAGLSGSQTVSDPQEMLEHMKLLLNALDEGDGFTTKQELLDALKHRGILESDPRLRDLLTRLKDVPPQERLTPEHLSEGIGNVRTLVEKALTGQLVIPNFPNFTQEIEDIFEQTKTIKDGKVADYIPQLARVDPERFGTSLCTIDGQRFSAGDATVPFCVQSSCKPINYCIALETHGTDKVHAHVGREPSGRGFNELTLNKDGLPHNPLINAGAIMCASLIHPNLDMADRFERVVNYWALLSGGHRPGFNNSIYLSERQTADRNFALGYFIREKQVFPDQTDLIETLEFYFQCCSLEFDCEGMAVIAATLANGGICPVTGAKAMSSKTAKHCLSLMHSCGMYDFSGEFSFIVGIPAKSGVSGIIMMVVPHVMGIAIWSPRLDSLGNSVRGIAFAKELMKRYNFHPYDTLTGSNGKRDPRLQKNQEKCDGIVPLCWAASQGDLVEIKRLTAMGTDLNAADYDGRTALHLAAANGHHKVIEYLMAKQVSLLPIDRWGNSPLDEACRGKHQECMNLLEGSATRCS